MAQIENTVKLKFDIRPCYVDGKKALFHRWAEQDKETIKFNAFHPNAVCYINRVLKEYETRHIIPTDCDVIKTTKTVAIIEYEDGSVAEVEPCRVKFVDDKIKEYAF